jgi:transcriptional regulator GlxA family with amidase domain
MAIKVNQEGHLRQNIFMFTKPITKLMIQVGLLVPHQYRLLSIAAILDVLETVNNHYKRLGQASPFQITLVTPADASAGDAQHFLHHQTQPLTADYNPDLVLVPSFASDDMKQALGKNAQFIPWLIKQYQIGAELASFCTGAFLLGASGLLNGRIATTHVDASNGFATAFPGVLLRADKTVTEDQRIYTSGGATSSFHLLLHLVQKHCGKDMAVKIAKIFAIDMDRHQQTYFSTFQPSRNHNDTLVATAQQKIENSYHNMLTIEEMIKDIPSSRRNMVRRFKQVTGITPIEYLQQTRIEAAKKLLEQTSQQMTEVILNTGYNDPKAFRKIFRKTVGMTPSEYREKFQTR